MDAISKKVEDEPTGNPGAAGSPAQHRSRLRPRKSRDRWFICFALIVGAGLGSVRGAAAGGETATAKPAEPDQRPVPGMKARVFQLKHLDPDDVVEALRPLMSDARGAMLRGNDDLNTVSARDFPENLAALEQALKRLDVPKVPQPDLEVQIRVLLGSPAAGAGSYPSELEGVVKQLGSTLSYKSYHLIAGVTQRLRAGASTSGKGELVAGPPAVDEKVTGHFHYNVENASVQPAAGPTSTPHFSLRKFKLRLEGGGLGDAEVSTGLSLREGEKVVVGTGNLKNRAMIVVVSARQLRP